MVQSAADKIKLEAINHPMVNMSSIGDIGLYDSKATILYPYVNIDVLQNEATLDLYKYTFRVYVCDRNQPYVAYNKTEMILSDLMRSMEIEKYNMNFFNLDFQDSVNGCYADVQFEYAAGCGAEAIVDYSFFNHVFLVLDNGDFITKNQIL